MSSRFWGGKVVATSDLVADIRRGANGRVDLFRHYEFGTELGNPIYVLC